MKHSQQNHHWKAFNHEWFGRHKQKLLWALNAPFLGWVLRRIWRMSESRSIVNIQPNSYTVNGQCVNGRQMLVTSFYTHWKFSKRLYYSFKPLWWAMHWLDELLLDEYFPRYSFGFTTLVVYPNPNTETVSVDGHVYGDELSATTGYDWSVIRDAATGTGSSDSASTMDCKIRCFSATNKWYQMRRIFTLFDTSSISTDEISSATYSLYFSTVSDGWGAYSVSVVSSNPASNTALTTADYDAVGATKFATDKTYASLSTAAYTDFALNASGLAAIAKTGITKFALRHSADVANTEPTWSSFKQDVATAYSADQTGTTNDPKLTVEHAAPAAATGSGVGRLKSTF